MAPSFHRTLWLLELVTWIDVLVRTLQRTFNPTSNFCPYEIGFSASTYNNPISSSSLTNYLSDWYFIPFNLPQGKSTQPLDKNTEQPGKTLNHQGIY
jgi:hypothetical protein